MNKRAIAMAAAVGKRRRKANGEFAEKEYDFGYMSYRNGNDRQGRDEYRPWHMSSYPVYPTYSIDGDSIMRKIGFVIGGGLSNNDEYNRRKQRERMETDNYPEEYRRRQSSRMYLDSEYSPNNREIWHSRQDMGDLHDEKERKLWEEKRTHRQEGYAMANNSRPETRPLNKLEAEEWAHSMENEDGSKGPKWSFEQIKGYMQQHNIDCNPIDFFVIMNAMYSDYCKVAKKYNVDTPEYYADLAKAFLEDKDAVKNKAAAYYDYIVK